ncbi:MAG: hypothetical protein GY772_31425, partial [bacterium]|nr:hypothetical protein [bacterium]
MHENFRGSGGSRDIYPIPDGYKGGGSRPGVGICICNCNDAIDGQWKVIPWQEAHEYWYHEIAKEMVLWEYSIAVVGGEARQWGITDDYKFAADRCRKILRSYWVLVVDGIQYYNILTAYRNPGERYHLSSNNDTQEGMRALFQACFDLVTTIQFPVPWWNANVAMDWPAVKEHLAKRFKELPDEERMVEIAEGAPPPVELDERDRLVQQHQDEVLSEHEGEGLTPRRRQAILDEDASQEVLREADAAEAAVAREAASSPQGIAGPAPTPPSASASHGSTGTTGSFEGVPDPMAAVVSPSVSDEEVLLQPGRSLRDEERRMMLRGRLSEIRGLTEPVRRTPAASTQAHGDVGDSAAQGSTVASSPVPAGGGPPVGGAP